MKIKVKFICLDLIRYFLMAPFIILLGIPSVSALEKDWQDPRTFLHFADNLADNKDYYRAITEYKRVIFHFPKYEKLDWVNFQIGRMYHLGGRFNTAKEYLVPLTASKSDKLSFLARNWVALTYYENHEYVNSARLFVELYKTERSDGIGSDYAAYAGMSHYFLGKYADAKKFFVSMEQKNSSLPVKKFKASALEIVERSEKRKRKTPWIAITTAIFPGGGHLYLGQWDTALVSLLVVGGTAFLAYDGFRKDSLVQGSIFLTFSSGFYVGSIYSAYRETLKYNATMYDQDHKLMNREFRRLTLRVSHRF